MENEFVLPDEYKDVQVLQGVTSVSDLCKRIIDKESFIGKLQSERAMPNENDGDDVWKGFFDKTKAVADKQDWSGMDEEFIKVAKESGLVKQQAKPIMDYIMALSDKTYDPEQWNTLKNERFKGKEAQLDKINAMLSKIPQKSIEAMMEIKNDQLLNVYDVFSDLADAFAVKEGMPPPVSSNASNQSAVYDKDGNIDHDVLSRMQDEIMAIGNVPNKKELKDAIFKKYGYNK